MADASGERLTWEGLRREASDLAFDGVTKKALAALSAAGPYLVASLLGEPTKGPTFTIWNAWIAALGFGVGVGLLYLYGLGRAAFAIAGRIADDRNEQCRRREDAERALAETKAAPKPAKDRYRESWLPRYLQLDKGLDEIDHVRQDPATSRAARASLIEWKREAEEFFEKSLTDPTAWRDFQKVGVIDSGSDRQLVSGLAICTRLYRSELQQSIRPKVEGDPETYLRPDFGAPGAAM